MLVVGNADSELVNDREATQANDALASGLGGLNLLEELDGLLGVLGVVAEALAGSASRVVVAQLPDSRSLVLDVSLDTIHRDHVGDGIGALAEAIAVGGQANVVAGTCKVQIPRCLQ